MLGAERVWILQEKVVFGFIVESPDPELSNRRSSNWVTSTLLHVQIAPTSKFISLSSMSRHRDIRNINIESAFTS